MVKVVHKLAIVQWNLSIMVTVLASITASGLGPKVRSPLIFCGPEGDHYRQVPL